MDAINAINPSLPDQQAAEAPQAPQAARTKDTSPSQHVQFPPELNESHPPTESSHAGIMGKERSNAEQERDPTLLRGTNIPKWKPNLTEAMVMVTLAILSLMVSLDATIIVTSLSTIVEALHATATQGFWIGTSYLLVVAVTMPFTASISDIVGRPQVLFTVLVSFTVGTILCAVSHSIGLMLVGRSLQGIGGGGVISLSLVIFSDIVPLRFRPQYVGVLQGAWALGSVFGPLIGGALAHPDSWRWVFYLMLPFCGIGLVFIPLFVRIRRPEATWRQMLSRVDWIGGFFFISSATSLLIAISWGGTTYAWDSWRTLVPLILGALGLIATLIYERYGAIEPFLRHSLFHVWSAHGIYFGAFAQGLVLYGQLYYIPFFFEAAKLYSPIHTGVALLPVLLTLVPASVVVGAIITRTGKYLWAIGLGWVLTVLGTGLTISWDRGTPTAVWAVEMIVLGFGHGLNLNALNTASQAVSKPGDEGRAVGMYAFLRSFGMAVGVGVSGSVFQNVMKSKLQDLDIDSAIATNAEAYLVILRAMDDTPARQAIVDAYVSGFHGVFGLLTGLGGLAFIFALFIKHDEINKELITDHKLVVEPLNVAGNRLSWPFSRPAFSRDDLTTSSVTASPITNTAPNSARQSRERVAEIV